MWALGEATVEQIVSWFPPAEQPNYKTTHTLLRIMETKGFLRHTARGKVFFFSPLVDEREVSALQVNRLLNQSFGGSAKSLLANLIESESLKATDLGELEQMIREYRTQKKALEPIG